MPSMLTLVKRFVRGAVVTLPITPAEVLPSEGAVPEKAATVPPTMKQMIEALDGIGKMSLEAASTEWAAAVSALREAQRNFNDADAEYIDTAITALNIAHMRVDNARQYLQKIIGLPPMHPAKEAGSCQLQKTAVMA